MKYNESNKPFVCMQTQSTCYKGTSKMVPKGVLWHSTGANNPTLKRYVQPSDIRPKEDTYSKEEWLEKLGKNQYNNDWNHIVRQAGLNAWIGKLADGTVTTIQTMPWDFKPWGCGSGPKGSCNNGWMQFEICEDNLTNKDYFEAAYKEACELTAYYCEMYNLDPLGTVQYNGVTVPVILCHQDSYRLGLGGDHSDVYPWFNKQGKTMQDVREDVAKLMGRTIPTTVPKEDVYTKGRAVKLSTNFKSTEFDCKGKNCCSETLIDAKLVNYLQNIRNHFGRAVNISSGYRCEANNKKVSESTTSQHVNGAAADIYINGVAPIEIAKYAEKIGVLGIGLYDSDKDGHFVHIDIRTKKAFWYGKAEQPRNSFLKEEKPQSGSTSDTSIKKDDLVKIAEDAVYYSGKPMPSWVKAKNWYVKSISGNRAVLDESEDHSSSINSPVDVKYLTKVNKQDTASKQPEQRPNEPVQQRPTLSEGSKSDDVEFLQTKLNILGFDCGTADGIFGSKTKKAVRALQAERNLSADGICGPKTWAEINKLNPYKVQVAVNALNIRTGPDATKFSVKQIAKKGQTFIIVYENNGWGKIEYGAGWLMLEHVNKI